MLNLPVSDIMNDHPIKVKSDVSIRNVAHLLLRYRINGILVVHADAPETLLGVFSMNDLLELMADALSKGARKMQALNGLSDKPIIEFLKKEYVRLDKNDNAAKAVALMHKKKALTIPVYDGEILVGVIGRHDIINIAFA
ncbi:MAG: CBS domain-containing protein [Candidatus Omnitrophica bacterium]|nr:CBS domain-containing protein [Candidatus Omnitrophota bacterium]